MSCKLSFERKYIHNFKEKAVAKYHCCALHGNPCIYHIVALTVPRTFHGVTPKWRRAQLGSLVFLHLLLIGTNRVLEGCVVMMQFKLCSKQLMSNYNLNIYPVLWFELQNDPFRDDLRPNTTVVLKVSAPAKGRASACYCVLALGCCSKSTSFVLCLEDCLLSFGPCWMLVVGTSLKPLQLQMR